MGNKNHQFTFSTIAVFIFPMLIGVTIAMLIYMPKYSEIEMGYYLQGITNNLITIEKLEQNGTSRDIIESELTMGNLNSGGYVAEYSTDSVLYGKSWDQYSDDMKVVGRVRYHKEDNGMEKRWCRVRAKDNRLYFLLSVVDRANDRIYRLVLDVADFLSLYIYVALLLVIAAVVSVLLSLVIYTLHIRPKIRKLRDSETRMSAELSIAHNVQMGLVRQNDLHYSDDEFDVYGIVRPAREVGGDFFYYTHKGKRFWFCIGDVSDKGAGAAILMAIVSSRLRASIELVDDLEAVNQWLNRTLIDEGNGMFCTMIIGYIEGDVVTFINCGHCPAFVVASDKKEVRKVQMVPNIPLGVLDEFEFKENTFTFNRGESLFLYTDGITDAVNGAKEMFGEQRLCDALSKGDDILAEVSKWRAGVDSWDDETELIITRKA